MSRHRRHFRDPREGCQTQPSASSPSPSASLSPSISLPPSISPPLSTSPQSASPPPSTSPTPSISLPPASSPLLSPASPPPQPPRADPLKLLGLPEELCRTPHWVLYSLRWSPGRGKWDKLPRQVDFHMASHADLATWSTFEKALTAFCGDSRFAGLGFVFSEDDPFVGFDLDDARDPVTGKILSPRLEEVIYGLASYTEVTPSGRGFHVLVKGRLPGGGRKNPSLGIEVYDRRRFFTMTGESLPGWGTIEERQMELDALYPVLFPSQELVAVGVRREALPSSLTDEELLVKAQAARNSGDFAILWRGDWQGAGYPSQSEADQALASHLAFWTGGDIASMDRLFRAGGLFRSKWDQVHYADGKTYGQVTLEHAAGRSTEFYRAGGTCPPQRGEERSPDEASQKSSDPLGRTDLGNARRLVERHGQDLHFVFSWRHWLVWDGLSWKEDSSGEAQRRAKETALSIGQAALDLPDSRQRELLLAHARASESVPRLEAMLTSAASEPGIPLAPDQLDSDPFLLNVANGTLDLRSGTLRAPRREDLLSKTAPVAYQPEAEAPTWMAFLERVTGDSLELCGFLQRIAGYCLSGDMRARCFFILYGRGANGKSTFLSTLLGMLGDYGQQGAAQTFIAIRGERVRNDLAGLRGARLVATMETEEGQRLATALVKQITGGDRLRARFLFAEEFDFQPQCKLFFATNAKPEIRDLGPAMWERVRLIPFGVTIPQEERDPLLLEKLRAEWPGILAWAVRGCRLWLEEGGMLLPPGEVAEATEGYREEMDRLVPFLDDCCLLDPEKQVNSKDLYAAYRRWCEESGEKPISQIALTKNLVERHTELTQIRGRGGRGLSGIGLTEEVLKELHVDAFDLSG